MNLPIIVQGVLIYFWTIGSILAISAFASCLTLNDEVVKLKKKIKELENKF